MNNNWFSVTGKKETNWLKEKIVLAINILFILYAFFMPLASDVSRQLLYLIALLWLLHGQFIHKLVMIKSSRVLLLYFSYILILLISLFFSESIQNGYWREKYASGYSYILSVHIKYFFIAIFLFTVGKKPYLLYSAYAYIAAMVVSEAASFGMLFDLVQTRMGDSTNPTPFMHYIFFSLYLNVGLFLALGLLTTNRIKLQPVIEKLLWIFCLITTVNILIIPSRLGYLTLFSGLLLTIFINRKKIGKRSLKLIAIFIGCLVLVTALNPSVQKRVRISIDAMERLANASHEETAWQSSIGARAALNIAGFGYLAKHPENIVYGLGMGDAKAKLNDFVVANYPEMKSTFLHRAHMHNQYLQILIDGGLIALFAILAMLYCTGKLKVGLLDRFVPLFLAVYLIYSLAEIPLQRPQPLSLFAVFLGILLAFDRIHCESEKNHPDLDSTNQRPSSR